MYDNYLNSYRRISIVYKLDENKYNLRLMKYIYIFVLVTLVIGHKLYTCNPEIRGESYRYHRCRGVPSCPAYWVQVGISFRLRNAWNSKSGNII